MFTDIFGSSRLKLGLHLHTTRSDGKKSPEEATAIYRAAGYDAITFTDHWKYGKEQVIDGLKIISGCEYNLGGRDARGCVLHIVGYGMKYDPHIPPDSSPQEIIDMIKAAGGLVTVAHPAWSLNTPEQILALRGVYATEIYNTVSDVHASNRPDSSLIADMLACRERPLMLTAADDVHYYEEDACVSWVMLKCDSTETGEILRALERGDFYATQGPEIHVSRQKDKIIVNCSPASRISFFNNTVWSPDRNAWGDCLTYAEYPIVSTDRFVRATATDKDGKTAWSNYIII